MKMPLRQLIAFSILLMTTTTFAEQLGLVKAEFIFDTASFAACHASTIVESRGGLVAAWFGGTGERSPDVGIWLSRYEQGHWTAPVEVANGVQHDAKRYPCWNPVLFQPQKGPLLLFYKVGPRPSAWWGMLMTSTDDGKTWSEPRRLPEDILGPVKNKPVELLNGDILCGSSTENDGWKIHFERTCDCGRTWEIIHPSFKDVNFGAIQPSILFHKDNVLQAVVRTDKGKIADVWSEDGGTHWGRVKMIDLPNPNSGIDAITLHDGRQLLVYNHTAKDRSPLNIAISKDGKTWDAAFVVENDPGQEFSYPAVIQSRDGIVHLVYTWHRKRIKHVAVDPDALELKKIVNGQWPG
jgi:predicted neuraminidase